MLSRMLLHMIKAPLPINPPFHLLTRNRRWASPKFLIGESYGTTRGAGLAGHLLERHGLALNGVMLVSSVLDFQTLLFLPGNDLTYIVFLPTFTATAWYHNRLPDDLQADLETALEESKAFALNEYALALLKGSQIGDEERAEVVRKLARLTGLSAEFIDRSELRVNADRFFKELRRDEGLTVGRLDSRFTGIDRDSAGETVEHDPSLSMLGAFTEQKDFILSFVLAVVALPWVVSQFDN